MSGAQTPSDALSRFLAFREELRSARVGVGGSEVCAALTDLMDSAVSAQFSSLEAGKGYAVVATGGYGRSELSPHSDIDLMLLHAAERPSEVASGLFRFLWDAGLRLGHSARTPKESRAAASERFDTHTTLLTTRLIVGDPDLYEEFSSEIAQITKARPLSNHLVSAERERRQREPYLSMAGDLKTGRGGLRTLQGFEWERRRGDLIGRIAPPRTELEAEAREDLLRVRNALHAVAGRKHDNFSVDLRASVAVWLELDVREVAERLVRATRDVDTLATRRWPELIEERDRSRSLRPRTRRLRKPLPRSARELDVDSFTRILKAGPAGRVALDDLVAGDGRVLPEWAVVRNAPQLAPFHEHPVADHLWRTVDEMLALIAGDGRYSAIADELGAEAVLIFAAFLHDVGKGSGGDHSSAGADAARRFCGALGMPRDDVALVSSAVLHHLLLSETATRRDLDDPAVIDEIADTVGDLRTLQVLYLLTVADSKATGSSMWTRWKETLLSTLFVRCASRFGADQPVVASGHEDDQPEPELQEHISNMPEDYRRSYDVPEASWHLALLAGSEEPASVGVKEGKGAQTVAVVGRPRPRFRLRTAEAFAANGVDVLEARLSTRGDGVIFDVFRVRDDVTGSSLSEDRIERFAGDLNASLRGELDTTTKVEARAAAYSNRPSADRTVRVSDSVDQASGDIVLTIACSDRVGRLAEILSVLFESGVEIKLAKLDSRAGRVRDSFHIRGDDVVPLDELGERLEERISASS